MTAQPESERRRTPRVRVSNHSFSMRVQMPARVLDIGKGGLLIDCPVGAQKGTTGILRMPLASSWFTSELEVRYELADSDRASGSLMGAAFTALPPESRQILERFLARVPR